MIISNQEQNVKINLISEKNRLQEFCQKNKLPMPLYVSWHEGLHHQLKWFAHVTVTIRDQKLNIKTAQYSDTKTDAENYAASLLLNHLSEVKLNEIKLNEIKLNEIKLNEIKLNEIKLSDVPFHNIINSASVDFMNITKVYFIDLENKPVFKHEFKTDAIYIGFLNSIHHSIIKYDTWHKCESDNLHQEIINSNCNKLLYLIDGAVIDLVDHFMTAMIYPLLNFIIFDKIMAKIVIVSGDHAGWCTRTCIEKILQWKKISVKIENVAYI